MGLQEASRYRGVDEPFLFWLLGAFAGPAALTAAVYVLILLIRWIA